MLKGKLLSSLVLIALVSGCDDDSNGRLIGSWKTSCIVDDSDPDYEESQIISYKFTKTELIYKEVIYSDLSCDEELIEFTLSGTYEVGENVLTPTGVDATEIDLILTSGSSSWGHDIDDYNTTLLQLFVIEGSYLYFGNGSVSRRATDIDFTSWLELQE